MGVHLIGGETRNRSTVSAEGSMTVRKALVRTLWISLTITVLCFAATIELFTESYHDPRWQVFDFNSRQATDLDIYAVADEPVISPVKLVGERKLRFAFNPPIRTAFWTVKDATDRRILSRGPYPDIKKLFDAYNFTGCAACTYDAGGIPSW